VSIEISEKQLIDRDSLLNGQDIKSGRLCAKINMGRKYRMEFGGRLLAWQYSLAFGMDIK